LRQIKAATNYFDISNKIGEGGFGPVYKVFCIIQKIDLIVIVLFNLHLLFIKFLFNFKQHIIPQNAGMFTQWDIDSSQATFF
jgi:hypothetical protein